MASKQKNKKVTKKQEITFGLMPESWRVRPDKIVFKRAITFSTEEAADAEE